MEEGLNSPANKDCKSKKTLNTNTKTITDDDSSLSQRLRSFSLKAAAVRRDANDSDTGSI
jgi:hypothetical protein